MVSKHGVAMLPKRYFAKVLATENGTLDGLHLSQTGHDAMAKILAGVIEPKAGSSITTKHTTYTKI